MYKSDFTNYLIEDIQVKNSLSTFANVRPNSIVINVDASMVRVNGSFSLCISNYYGAKSTPNERTAEFNEDMDRLFSGDPTDRIGIQMTFHSTSSITTKAEAEKRRLFRVMANSTMFYPKEDENDQFSPVLWPYDLDTTASSLYEVGFIPYTMNQDSLMFRGCVPLGIPSLMVIKPNTYGSGINEGYYSYSDFTDSFSLSVSDLKGQALSGVGLVLEFFNYDEWLRTKDTIPQPDPSVALYSPKTHISKFIVNDSQELIGNGVLTLDNNSISNSLSNIIKWDIMSSARKQDYTGSYDLSTVITAISADLDNITVQENPQTAFINTEDALITRSGLSVEGSILHKYTSWKYNYIGYATFKMGTLSNTNAIYNPPPTSYEAAFSKWLPEINVKSSTPIYDELEYVDITELASSNLIIVNPATIGYDQASVSTNDYYAMSYNFKNIVDTLKTKIPDGKTPLAYMFYHMPFRGSLNEVSFQQYTNLITEYYNMIYMYMKSSYVNNTTEPLYCYQRFGISIVDADFDFDNNIICAAIRYINEKPTNASAANSISLITGGKWYIRLYYS